MFKEINPKYDEAINSLSEVALENEQIIDELVFEVFENDKIIKKKFESLKPGLQQRAVHRFLVKAGVEYDRKRVLDVLSYISKRKKYSLTTNL